MLYSFTVIFFMGGGLCINSLILTWTHLLYWCFYYKICGVWIPSPSGVRFFFPIQWVDVSTQQIYYITCKNSILLHSHCSCTYKEVTALLFWNIFTTYKLYVVPSHAFIALVYQGNRYKVLLWRFYQFSNCVLRYRNLAMCRNVVAHDISGPYSWKRNNFIPPLFQEKSD